MVVIRMITVICNLQVRSSTLDLPNCRFRSQSATLPIDISATLNVTRMDLGFDQARFVCKDPKEKNPKHLCKGHPLNRLPGQLGIYAKLRFEVY